MLETGEIKLVFGHRIHLNANGAYEVINDAGQLMEKTDSLARARRMHRALQTAYIRGRYHSSDKFPTGKVHTTA